MEYMPLAMAVEVALSEKNTVCRFQNIMSRLLVKHVKDNRRKKKRKMKYNNTC